MKNKVYYHFTDIKGRKVTFCTVMSRDYGRLEVVVGMAVCSPEDEFVLTKGMLIAKNRARTILKKVKGEDKLLVRTPYIYRGTVDNPWWRGVDFADYAENLMMVLEKKIKNNFKEYIPSYHEDEESTIIV